MHVQNVLCRSEEIATHSDSIFYRYIHLFYGDRYFGIQTKNKCLSEQQLKSALRMFLIFYFKYLMRCMCFKCILLKAYYFQYFLFLFLDLLLLVFVSSVFLYEISNILQAQYIC